METLLAGDIGGTHTRLALYDPAHLREPLLLRRYGSGDYESLQSILQTFLAEPDVQERAPGRAAFGVAGPVEHKIVKLTNLPWVIDPDQLADRTGIPKVKFINDFAANCLAVTQLAAEDLHRIGGGQGVTGGPIAVLGAGTGLGEGFLVHSGTEYVVVSSEGGHADFAPRNALEIRLLTHLTQKFGRVSYERVVSGHGLVNLYEFFRDSEAMPESPTVREQMRREDPAAVVSRNALEHTDSLCERALDLFCTCYGAEAGNLALKVLATGGVYLAGGIAGKIIPKLEEGGFRHGFEHKGRFTAFLEHVPVYVIVHAQPGLMGAAIAASRL